MVGALDLQWLPGLNGRNFYLTQALELEGRAEVAEAKIDDSVAELVKGVPIRNFMAAMPVNLNPEKSADTDLRVGFRFSDVNEGYGIHVRRGVAEFREGFPESPDVSVTLDSKTWKEIVLRLRNPALALASDDVQVDGGTLELVGFLRMFQP